MKLDMNNPEVRSGILNFMPGLNLDDPETQAAVRDFGVPIHLINQIRIAGNEAYRLAPQITAPALVIQGRNDELVQPEFTQQLMSRLGGTTQYSEVNGAHDLVFADRPAWSQIEHLTLQFAKKFISEQVR
jgi:pimeloyl-ACP methyl ester carboxylesterase